MAAKRVTNTIRQRREPVQARSRETVGRILEAAAELIEAEGLDAVTTRAIAERAGVSAPSLYRFFADRDEIFDRLLSTQLAELDRRAEAADSRAQDQNFHRSLPMRQRMHAYWRT